MTIRYNGMLTISEGNDQRLNADQLIVIFENWIYFHNAAKIEPKGCKLPLLCAGLYYHIEFKESKLGAPYMHGVLFDDFGVRMASARFKVI